jgi:hypothetical protein
MNPNIAEIVTEARFHLTARRRVEGMPILGKGRVHDRRRHVRAGGCFRASHQERFLLLLSAEIAAFAYDLLRDSIRLLFIPITRLIDC